MKMIISLMFLLILTVGAMAYEAHPDLVAWYSMDNADTNATILQDVWDSNDASNDGIDTNQIGVFNEGVEAINANTDSASVADNNSMDITAANELLIAGWAYMNSDTNGEMMWKGASITADFWRIGYSSGADDFFCTLDDNANQFSVIGTQFGAPPTNQWGHHACIINTTGLFYYFNGTYDTMTARAPDVDASNGNAMYIGKQDNGVGDRYMDAYLDELVIIATSNETIIAQLYNYNNITGLGGGGAPAGESVTVTLSTPANDTHNNVKPANWNYTPVWVGILTPFIDECTLFVNGTEQDSEANPTNNTINSLNYVIPSEGVYEWVVGCNHTNGTRWNSSTWYFTFDETVPWVNITTPTNGQNIYYGESTNMFVTANDTNMFNLTCDVYFDNGTFIGNYTNQSGTPPTFELHNEFTSSLGTVLTENQSYWLNCSGQDSHTDNNWEADHIVSKDKEFKVTKNGKSIKTTWNWTATASFSELTDRVKWGINATSDTLGDIKVKFHVVSDCEVTLVPSNYAGHYVTCGMWGDYQDLKDDGFDVKVTKEAWNTIEVEIEKSGLTPSTVYYLDPATGGLNTGWDNNSFNIVENSVMSVSWGAQYLNVVGFGTITYQNISGLAHIPAATCNYTITDPGLHIHTQTLTDETTFYFGNYTPDHIGTHNVTVQCAKAGWTTQIFTGQFVVNNAPTSSTISIDSLDNLEGFTSRTCIDNMTLQYVFTEQACLGTDCSVVNRTRNVFCENGCTGAICQRSLVTDSGALLWYGGFFLMLAVLWWSVGKRGWRRVWFR